MVDRLVLPEFRCGELTPTRRDCVRSERTSLTRGQAVAATAPNNPKCYIAETGWPSQSLTRADSNSGFGGPEGEATVPNLQSKSNLIE